MKMSSTLRISYIVAFVFFVSCETSGVKDENSSIVRQKKDTVVKSYTEYSSDELRFFFDSIATSDPGALGKVIGREADSIFYGRKTLNIELSKSDFDTLQYYVNDGSVVATLPLAIAERIFPFKIDSNAWFNKDLVVINHYNLSHTKDMFTDFSICIGSPNGSPNSDVYFFNEGKIISHHSVYHTHGLQLKSFKAEDGNTVIYYRQNFGTGSGVWQHNYFFYKYEGEKLLPVLNIIENSNLRGWGTDREFWFKSAITQKRPLTIKYVYNFQLVDEHFARFDVINDSAVVEYAWSSQKKKYLPIAGTEFDQDMYTYYLNCNELYVINKYRSRLKQILEGNDSLKRNATYQYLNKIKNNACLFPR